MSDIDEQIRALQRLKEAGYESVPGEGRPAGGRPADVSAGTGTGSANGRPAADAAGTGAGAGTGTDAAVSAGQAGGQSDNGYYELKDCKVVRAMEEQIFGENRVRTVVFEYKPKKSDKKAMICADAWNETIRYNEFRAGEYYDLSLRVSCREAGNGRVFPNVTIAFAHRLRTVTFV